MCVCREWALTTMIYLAISVTFVITAPDMLVIAILVVLWIAYAIAMIAWYEYCRRQFGSCCDRLHGARDRL
jgi:predicted RND superfamily exporter protein